jgi:hypothetical protein
LRREKANKKWKLEELQKGFESKRDPLRERRREGNVGHKPQGVTDRNDLRKLMLLGIRDFYPTIGS